MFSTEMKKVNKQCLLDTPRSVRVSEKKISLARDSSNQQTLVLKKDFSRICENKISVESVQMILSLQSGTFFKVKIIHT